MRDKRTKSTTPPRGLATHAGSVFAGCFPCGNTAADPFLPHCKGSLRGSLPHEMGRKNRTLFFLLDRCKPNNYFFSFVCVIFFLFFFFFVFAGGQGRRRPILNVIFGCSSQRVNKNKLFMCEPNYVVGIHLACFFFFIFFHFWLFF